MHLASEKLMKCKTCSAENQPAPTFATLAARRRRANARVAILKTRRARSSATIAEPGWAKPRPATRRRLPNPSPQSSSHESEGERRHLTVLFADLVGSTELSQRFDPEDYREIVRAYHQAAEAVVARFDGHIAQYLGDGVVVYFGWPRAHGDDAERAVRAGLALLDALAEVNRTIPDDRRIAARVGVHTGPVVIGEIGGGTHREIAALGATPNVAARVQSLGEPNSILMTAQPINLRRDYSSPRSWAPRR